MNLFLTRSKVATDVLNDPDSVSDKLTPSKDPSSGGPRGLCRLTPESSFAFSFLPFFLLLKICAAFLEQFSTQKMCKV